MSGTVLRTCIGCRRVRPKPALLRLVRGSDGAARVDESGTAPGRGAYVCPGRGCIEAAVKRGRLAQALRGPVENARELLVWAERLNQTG